VVVTPDCLPPLHLRHLLPQLHECQSCGSRHDRRIDCPGSVTLVIEPRIDHFLAALATPMSNRSR
jgi:hypothetical protein